MSTPFRCKLGMHSWGAQNTAGRKICKFCRVLSIPKRCKSGAHYFENKVRGKVNTCKLCGGQYYVKTRKEALKDSLNDDGSPGVDAGM